MCMDPFRPSELNQRRIPNTGAPPKLPAKPHKANRILATQNVQNTINDLPSSVRKRQTQSIRNSKRGLTVSTVNNGQ